MKITIESDEQLDLPLEIEQGIEPAPEPKPKKHRARRKKEEVIKAANGLLKALAFVKPAQSRTKSATTQERFCSMKGNWLAATNNMLTIATPVEEDLNACPQTAAFEVALKETGEQMAITQLSQFQVAIQSGEFKAVVPCIESDQLYIAPPDQEIAKLDNRLITAFKALTPLIKDKAEKARYGSILLQSGLATAGNGPVIVEYWHGIDLPPNLLIPRAAAVACVKAKKDLRGFGFSPNSVTFWFEDGSFIKTRLYNEEYPPYQKLFDNDRIVAWELPENFFKALKAIEKQSEDGKVYLRDGQIVSNEEENASTYNVDGVYEDIVFTAKTLLSVQKLFQRAFFDSETKRAYFFYENEARGIVSGVI